MNNIVPVSQVLLTIPKALSDELITDSGVKFYLDPEYHKEQNVAVVATIAALPIKYSKQDKKILDQLKVGDEVCVSYSIVADFEFKSDSDRFMKATEDNPYVEEYTNSKGEWVKIYAVPNLKGLSKIQWVGVYQDRNRKVIDGTQGTERDVKRWLSQFQIGKTDIYNFNNYFEYNGAEYWKCSPNLIFAKKENGHLVAIGDRVISRPIEEDVPREIARAIVTTTDDVKIRYQDRGKVLTGGKEIGIKKEQTISFPPLFNEKYKFYNKDYFLIRQKYIGGIWNNN